MKSHSSFESELVLENEYEGDGEVSKVETSEDGSLRGEKTERDFEGHLWIGELVGAVGRFLRAVL